MWRGAFIGFALCLAACAAPESEQGFDKWRAAAPERGAAFADFEAMLEREGVSGVVPNFQLWRADADDPACTPDAFTVPEREHWPNVVATLRFVRDHVEPAVGEVEVISGYRDQAVNDCVGGASQSAHRLYYALDMVPVDRAVTQEALYERLCALHAREGAAQDVGLGLYKARRFHIDTRSFRRWGHDFRAGSSPCLAFE